MDTSIFRRSPWANGSPGHTASVSGLSMSACCWTTRRVRPCAVRPRMEGRPDVRHEFWRGKGTWNPTPIHRRSDLYALSHDQTLRRPHRDGLWPAYPAATGRCVVCNVPETMASIKLCDARWAQARDAACASSMPCTWSPIQISVPGMRSVPEGVREET